MRKEKTETAAADEGKAAGAGTAEVTVSEASGAEGAKAPAAHEAAKAKKEPGNLMYVGPTVPDFAIQNGVYTQIPKGAADKIEAEPELGNLFIEISDYPKANKMLRERQGYIFRAYAKALGLRK
ncbi:MAG: hypothetical protein IJS41_03825 [Clostridia bacterium]|nr:hypothetical protein [Clostridia bacterium]